mgnify:CR=1 FL=1
MNTKLTLIFLAIFCSLQISAQIEKKYYSDTITLKETGNLKNGLKDGIWETYYENGKLETVGNYTDGEKKGEWKVYFDNGKLAAVGKYTSTKFPTPRTWRFYTNEGVEEVFNCPKPSKENLNNVCVGIYVKMDARDPDSDFNYSFQEELWKISCAKPGIDILETARIKIQLMWNENREYFRCYGYPNSIATDKNVTKFSLDSGFTTFLVEGVRKYQLDMNFIDPEDSKTILDYIEKREKEIRNSPPVDTPRADQYKRIYNLLRSNGAKHGSEL